MAGAEGTAHVSPSKEILPALVFFVPNLIQIMSQTELLTKRRKLAEQPELSKKQKKDKKEKDKAEGKKKDKGKSKAHEREFKLINASLVVSIAPVFAGNPRAGVEEMLDSMIMRCVT